MSEAPPGQEKTGVATTLQDKRYRNGIMNQRSEEDECDLGEPDHFDTSLPGESGRCLRRHHRLRPTQSSTMSPPCVTSCDCPYVDASFLSNICVQGYGSGAGGGSAGTAGGLPGTSTMTALTLFLGVVEMVLRSKCDIAEPCRRASPDAVLRKARFEYDFIVVGAGVAGSVVAARLSEDPRLSVLLLEAGPEEPLATLVPAFAVKSVGTFLDWGFETEPQKGACEARGGRCRWPRGKMVAGTGGMQGMMYVRGHPAIYDSWAHEGNPGWSFADVLPYFRKSERNHEMNQVDGLFHGSTGPLSVQRFSHRPALARDLVRGGEEIGLLKSSDLNGWNQTGFSVAQMMVYNGLRGSTARMYLRPAMGRPNLVVNSEAHVNKVLINPIQRRATGVQFTDRDGNVIEVAATREVILSAGAVGSPHILLLSGIGPSEELEQVGIRPILDLPVGRSLHNHVSMTVTFIVDDLRTRRQRHLSADKPEVYVDDNGYLEEEEFGPMSMAALHQFMDTKGGPLASTGLTQTTAMLTSKFAENGVPDIQVYFDGFHAGCESELRRSNPCSVRANFTESDDPLEPEAPDIQVKVDVDGLAKRIRCPMVRRIAARPTATRTLSRGFLRLKSANPRDHPLIFPNYFGHERDLLVLVDAVRQLSRLPEAPTLQKWGLRLDDTLQPGCEHLKFGDDSYWKCVARVATGPENHQAGSCRMGPAGDSLSVVDAELRVHGMPNLRVVDASMMPTVPNSNTIAGVVMVAEKASDLIRGAWTPYL